MRISAMGRRGEASLERAEGARAGLGVRAVRTGAWQEGVGGSWADGVVAVRGSLPALARGPAAADGRRVRNAAEGRDGTGLSYGGGRSGSPVARWRAAAVPSVLSGLAGVVPVLRAMRLRPRSACNACRRWLMRPASALGTDSRRLLFFRRMNGLLSAKGRGSATCGRGPFALKRDASATFDRRLRGTCPVAAIPR
ncbi:MAG: hypothetical protein JWO82_2180 [Akkermansiaceae bacterium]|nr:hypothetical protein [Akkermansiaceae bacterium]